LLLWSRILTDIYPSSGDISNMTLSCQPSLKILDPAVSIGEREFLSPTCQICDLNPSQYKCPRCLLMTCSLTCCKKHKSDVSRTYTPLLWSSDHQLPKFTVLQTIRRNALAVEIGQNMLRCVSLKKIICGTIIIFWKMFCKRRIVLFAQLHVIAVSSNLTTLK
jgi:hypothetical protein